MESPRGHRNYRDEKMSSFDKKLQDPESIPSRVLGDAGLNFVTAHFGW